MNLITRLKHRPVRDLAWALCQPQLFTHIPGLPKQWLLLDYIDADIHQWLKTIDDHPTPLLDHLSQQRSTRLGIYFEQLLSFYFEYHPRFTLLAKNYQVNNTQRTLGEFDFIVYDQLCQCTKHIEAAVKFYLGNNVYTGNATRNTPLHNWHQWVGPSHKDTLAIKMQHLINHQLPLAITDEGQAALSQLIDKPESVRSRLLFAGRFYFPNYTVIAAPTFSEKVSESLHWMTCDTFLNAQQNNKSKAEHFYCRLPRQYWFSPLLNTDLSATNLEIYSGGESISNLILEDRKQGEQQWQFTRITPQQATSKKVKYAQ